MISKDKNRNKACNSKNFPEENMSLIRPRPLLVQYLPLYDSRQKRRQDMRCTPGIMGWEQVNGRNAISWEKKFDLDVWYVYNFSFFLDVRII